LGMAPLKRPKSLADFSRLEPFLLSTLLSRKRGP